MLKKFKKCIKATNAELFLNFAKRNSLVVFSIFGKYMKLSGVDKKTLCINMFMFKVKYLFTPTQDGIKLN